MKELTSEQIADLLLNNIGDYKENIKELIVLALNKNTEVKTDWNDWLVEALKGKHTSLGQRVWDAMGDANYIPYSEKDIYPICKNITRHKGDDPTDKEIREEVEIFYKA
jgi:hypothetical protein